MPKFRLSDLDLDEISIVPSGDNHGAKVLIAKAASDDYDVEVDENGQIVEKRATHSSRIHGGLDRSPKENWVDQAGGLPSYIERIAKHLHYDQGMTIGRAIATAVNQVKKWAAGGEGVKPDTQAKAAKALAEWEAKKAKARIKKRRNPGQLTPHPYRNRDVQAHGPTKCDKCGQNHLSPMHKIARKKGLAKHDDDKSQDVVDSGANLGAQDSVGEGNMPPENDDQTTLDVSDLPSEVVDYIEALEAEVTTLNEKLEAGAPPAGDDDGEKPKSEEELVLAKADPAVRALIEKQEARIKEAEEIAKAERDARLTREYIEKASHLPMINTDTGKLGGLLRKLAEKAPEEAAEVEDLLKAANEQIAKGNLFTEFGKGGAETTVSKSVDAHAVELMKANPEMTREQAIAQVYEQNPDLYEQSLKEG